MVVVSVLVLCCDGLLRLVFAIWLVWFVCLRCWVGSVRCGAGYGDCAFVAGCILALLSLLEVGVAVWFVVALLCYCLGVNSVVISGSLDFVDATCSRFASGVVCLVTDLISVIFSIVVFCCDGCWVWLTAFVIASLLRMGFALVVCCCVSSFDALLSCSF